MDLTAWSKAVGFEPAPHHAMLITALEKLTNGSSRRLMVMMPPGSGKSIYTSLNLLLGSLAAMASAVVSYWVGSSAGSARKEEHLAAIASKVVGA